MGGLVKAIGGLVGGIFGGGDTKAPPMPKLPDPPLVPTVDEAAKAVEESDRLKKRKGRAATILTGKKGAATPKGATAELLGE